MNDVVTQNVTAELLDLLDADASLGPRILQLHRQGFFSQGESTEDTEKMDPESPFHRGRHTTIA